jgi:TRAP transporter TAXI family solute receptor
LIKLKLLPERNIDLATRNSSGSLENIARLRDKTSEFAIVQALLGRFARSGTGIAANLGPQRDLRAVMMLWPNVEHFIVRRNLASSGTIEDFLALDGRRVSLGRERSAIESNRVLLGNLGLNIDRDIDQAFLAFRASVAAFQRGEIDALSLPASTPVPAFTELLAQLGDDATILSWTEDQRRRADNGLGLWSPLTIPANTYVGQDEPIETIAQPNFLAVSADTDDDVVYAITKTVFENLPFLGRLHEPYRFLTPERAITGLPVPLHPGARRYFEEIGLDLDPVAIAADDYRLFGDGLETTAALRNTVNRGTVSLVTAEDGTSSRMADELLDVMGANADLRVLPIKGKGTAHNLADLLYLNGIDLGVLQLDALDFEKRRTLYPELGSRLRFISKWTDNEIHLLVRDDVLAISELRDQSVNFGPVGSGSEVTASLLFNRLRISVDQTSLSHARALDKLKSGDIAGMVYVAAKPLPLFRDVEVRDGLRLLSLPELAGSELYQPADLTVDDYPTLIFGKQIVKTWSVPSVLATYNWPSDSDRYGPIAGFVDRFLDHIGDLQSDAYHAKWGDIDPAFDFRGGWQRHPLVDEHLRQLRTAESSSGQGGPLKSADSVDAEALPAPPARAIETRLPRAMDGPAESNTRHRPVF